MSEQRYSVFERGFRPSAKLKNPLEKLKGVNATQIPPCESEIRQQIKRASFVARMWGAANQSEIQQHPTEYDGWTMQNESYEIIWFDGPQLPAALVPETETELDDLGSLDDDDFEVSSSDEEDLSLSDDDVD